VANFNQGYAPHVPLTITLASLASSTARLAGRQSAVYDNTATGTFYLDFLVAGKVTTGTSPTAGVIEVWAFGQLEDTPTFGDVLTAADAAVTLTSDGIKASLLRLVAVIATDATSNRTYPFAPTSLASLFGGMLPKRVGMFVTHSTVAALNATAGNHAIWMTPGLVTSP
jgi:hypothetical protein